MPASVRRRARLAERTERDLREAGAAVRPPIPDRGTSDADLTASPGRTSPSRDRRVARAEDAYPCAASQAMWLVPGYPSDPTGARRCSVARGHLQRRRRDEQSSMRPPTASGRSGLDITQSLLALRYMPERATNPNCTAAYGDGAAVSARPAGESSSAPARFGDLLVLGRVGG